jgi:organic hydroperoxide reductase OsmC/OhrA
MSEHKSTLHWARGERGFGYEEYAREHTLAMGGGDPIRASAAQAFRGDPSLTNPEDLLVGALSSCHMLTFLAICARKNIVVDAYDDDATGWLERPSGAPMHVTRVTLRPRVRFAGSPPDAATLASLHEQAHRGCFIASSVKTDVKVEPQG